MFIEIGPNYQKIHIVKYLLEPKLLKESKIYLKRIENSKNFEKEMLLFKFNIKNRK